MSDAVAEATVAAPAAPPVAAEPAAATPAPTLSRADRAARGRELIRASFEAARAGRSAPAPAEPAPAASPAEPVAATPEPTAATPAPAPAAPVVSAEQRLADVLEERFKADRRAFDLEQREKQLKSELEAERAKWAEIEKDPFRKAAASGKTYAELTAALVNKEFDALTPEQVAMQRYESELKTERERREAIEARLNEEDKRKDFERRHGVVREKVTQSAEKYPFVHALDWMHGQAVSQHQARESQGVDLDTVLGELNEAAAKDLRSVFSSDAAIKHLLADETTRNRVLAVLGPASAPTPPQPAGQAVVAAPIVTPEGPKSLPSRKVGESGERVRPVAAGRSDRRANAVRIAAAAIGKR